MDSLCRSSEPAVDPDRLGDDEYAATVHLSVGVTLADVDAHRRALYLPAAEAWACRRVRQ